ncbi:GyrI-like domain-containing protein, partial [bacterium]|nr:GyrI-like domain-containing protein [bacterium]
AIELKESDQFYYCALEMMGSYEQAGSAIGTLYGEAAKQNLVIDMVPFGIYYNNPADTPEEELKWEVGFALPEKREVQEPLKIKKWEYNLLVSKYYDGSFESEEMVKTYQQIFSWIGENSYIPAGPIMEKYLNIPVRNEAGEMCGKVEILVPVQKKE